MLKFLVILVLSFLLSGVFSVLNFFLAPVSYNVEKTAIYECGFDPISDSRDKFEVRYYMLAILFIVFDIELMFMWPWVISLSFLGFSSFLFMFFFLLILTIGFFFEWSSGALEWR